MQTTVNFPEHEHVSSFIASVFSEEKLATERMASMNLFFKAVSQVDAIEYHPAVIALLETTQESADAGASRPKDIHKKYGKQLSAKVMSGTPYIVQ